MCSYAHERTEMSYAINIARWRFMIQTFWLELLWKACCGTILISDLVNSKDDRPNPVSILHIWHSLGIAGLTVASLVSQATC